MVQSQNETVETVGFRGVQFPWVKDPVWDVEFGLTQVLGDVLCLSLTI